MGEWSERRVNARDVSALQRCAEDLTASPALARRARIVLLCAQGMAPTAVARQLDCSRQTVATWLGRYRAEGIDGLRDAPRPGRPARLNPAAVVVRTLQAPRGGHDRWSTRRLAAEFGISNVAVAKIWRQWGIRPESAGRATLLTEPVVDAAIVDVVGLFVSGPMVVFAVVVGEPRKRAGTAVGLGRAARSQLVASAAPGGCDVSSSLVGFLDRLQKPLRNHTSRDHRDDAGRSTPIRLLVRGDETLTRRWTLGQDAVAVHVIPPDLAWDRTVRVGCLMAGADGLGAASVQSLRMAITEHGDRGVFQWIRTPEECDGPTRAMTADRDTECG